MRELTASLEATKCPCGNEASIWGGHVRLGSLVVGFGEYGECRDKPPALEKNPDHESMGYVGEWTPSLGLAFEVMCFDGEAEYYKKMPIDLESDLEYVGVGIL